MFAIERREKILQILQENGTAKTVELCEALAASPATIRNDLHRLARQGKLQKIHGGAALQHEEPADSPASVQNGGMGQPDVFSFRTREMQHAAEKDAIAEAALKYIKNNQCILLDASSTALTLAKKLACFRKLLVVTNGVYTMLTLKDTPNIDTIIIGGIVRKNSGFIEGTIGADILRHFHVDVAFVSANGFSEKEGLTDFNIYEVELKRRMLENCNHIIAMIDSSKFARVSSSSFLATEAIDVLLTDDKVSPELVARYKSQGINVQVCACRR
ncbi:DeoR/GlpR family DNA-binding transcription regulator [Selenomonas sputigena]|uniref:DeoR/GlpR family DNA-binding transcription regulator n=1 Tax=Selenomonas sputigena TaxID=69823 RepID=A0ABV3X3B2_9FIRM